jgi:TatD DNase family protein
VLAIGEAGIDKLSQTNLSLQINIFEQHARLAEQLGKPLIIHAVRATDELIKLKKSIRPTQAWIIHGFRGKAALADEYIRQGFYLSFGDKYQEEALRTMPVERFFIETDESTTPVDALYERAAALRNTPPEAFKEAIRQNIERLFF